MEWVEVTAKTVEDAKDKALDYLGVDEAQADFEIIEEPRRGLLGRMKGDARVRARVKPSHPRPKAERRDRRRGRKREEGERTTTEAGGGGGARRRPPGSAAREGTSSDAGTGRSATPRSRGGSRRTPAQDAPGEVPAVAAEASSGASSGPRPNQRRRRRPGEGEDGGPREGRPDDARANVEVDDVSLARELDAAEQFLEGLVGAFGFDATVRRGTADEEVQEIAITGGDLGLLIGPKGSTLEAVQELTRLAARRQVDGRAEARIRVDVSGYRERRRAALERFVRVLAEEVRVSGAQKALEPMTSPDRKVVHDTVSALDGVATVSEGEEPNRRVVIIPE